MLESRQIHSSFIYKFYEILVIFCFQITLFSAKDNFILDSRLFTPNTRIRGQDYCALDTR